MASYYVDSTAAGAGTGADWANAYTTIATAMSGKAAGDIFYLAHDHAETAASAVTLTSPGTAASPCFFYCVDSAGTVPPVSADLRDTATITRTGASSGITLTGVWFVDGVTFTCGSGGTNTIVMTLCNANALPNSFRNCTFRNLTTGTGTILTAVNTALGATTEFINCDFEWNGTAGSLSLFGEARWIGGAVIGSTFPTTLFVSQARGTKAHVRGVDLSALGSGKTLVNNGTSMTAVSYLFDRCKLDASVTRAAAITTPGAQQADFVHCGSSGVSYDVSRHWYEGVLTTETTIVRTGGASDGTTGVAWKIDTTANAKWERPFISPPIVIWNTVDGSAVTVTVEGVWGGGAVPDDDDIWLEVTYLGDNASPLGTVLNDTKANGLAAGAAHSSSAETWGGSTTEFSMSATFTPQQAGLISVRVKVGKASDTFYIDPKITLS